MSSDRTNHVTQLDRKRTRSSTTSPVSMSVIVFACVFGGALFGIYIHSLLPSTYLDSDSREAVRLGMALVGTTVAVALGLLIASGKDFYDAQTSEVTQLATNLLLLDKILNHYGPETNKIRKLMRSSVVQMVDVTWGRNSSDTTRFTLPVESESFLVSVQELSPRNDSQRFLQSQALNTVLELARTRSLMIAQKTSPVPMPMLSVLVLWLTLLFISFGLFVRPNLVVVVSLFASALAVCGAIFLILEVYHPYRGWIQISSVPLRTALPPLVQ